MAPHQKDSLFTMNRERFLADNAPLADRMRPRTLDEFCGQEKIVGPGRLLRRAIQADQLSSLIFYGPPGSGKTTLARIIAQTTKADFITLNAVLSGVKDIRNAIDKAKERLGGHSRRTILFIDEVHRFNKMQQDALLPHVENGTVIFVGATTENPYFEVNKALLSRSRIFELATLENEHLVQIAMQAINNPERGFGKLKISFENGALEHLVEMANGDARALLNALELAVQTTEADQQQQVIIDRQVAEESIQKKAVLYDKDGDAHYDVISAFIKSIRGSDPDAALYWLAKMVYAGEDPRFIFRRLIILASEDVGMADPQALQVVMSAAQAFDYVGLPEGRFALAHACVYLATSQKSNSLFAFFSALESVSREKEGEVPNHLKDSARDGDDLGHGKNYLYPHAYRDHWTAQQYLPTSLQGRVFYQPSAMGYEKIIKSAVERKREEQFATFHEQRQAAGSGQNDAFFEVHSMVKGKTRSQWLQRTLNNWGGRLGENRDTIYQLADCKPQDLLLVLNDPSGLLLWEGLRRTGQGGAYSLLADEQDVETLTAQSMNLEELERPILLQGGIEELQQLAAKEQGLLFDVVVGRNLHSFLEITPDFIDLIAQYISTHGRIVIAENLPRFNQRLYRLLPVNTLPAAIMDGLIRAEETIYASSALDWCEEEQLQQIYSCPSLPILQILPKKSQGEMYISRRQIESWFTPRERGKKESYCQHLAKTLAPGELEMVRASFLSCLADKVCGWENVTAYITITK